MGRLILVRHAQASFLSQNYDQLSSLGETQSALLGAHWVHRGVAFARACTGPSLRHRQTAQLVADAYRREGLDFPALSTEEAFAEFPGEALLSQSLPRLLSTNLTIRNLHSDMQNASTEATKRATFQRLFEAIAFLWVGEEIQPANVESWQDFSARVNRGLSNFLGSAAKGETSVIFTSGGPIGLAVQRALHLSSQDTLQIAWMSRNCSFSEFLFSGHRFMLSSFNSYPHLDSEALLTYR